MNTSIAIECYARSNASTSPDVAVDAVIEAVYARIDEDTTLGGAVAGIGLQGIGYDFDSDGQSTTCATLVFHLIHRTAGLIS